MGLRFHDREMEPTEAPQNGFPIPAGGAPVADMQGSQVRRQSAPILPPSHIPPDLLDARRARINQEITSMFRSRRDSNSEWPPSTKGIGTYTHVELPALPPLFPHQQYFKPRIKFLPLGGPNRVRRPPNRVEPNLQEHVKEAYETLAEVLLEEEQLDSDAFSPATRFHALPVPEGKTVAPVVRQARDDMAKDTNQTDSAAAGSSDGRRSSLPYLPQRQPSWGGQRSLSIPGMGKDVNMGRTTTTSGSTYDASRDPRRKGR